MFKNKHVEFVFVCIGTIDEVDQVFVCGEDQAFFESDCDLVKALFDLISAYYVFDVNFTQLTPREVKFTYIGKHAIFQNL